ncbi:MAG: hypothetical protein A2X53_10360 [Candidatus Rokubacteria bacterium GWA2_70_23]|nr:MAG: hypothetical protein A2X53_10360 [Candidatus Rokubacteria bacterium GWA2_70_23]
MVGAVPTVWIAIHAILEKEPQWDISSIRCILIGGWAAPKSLLEIFDKKYGANMLHAWGMTEMTPIGTVCRLKSYMEALPDEERYAIRAKQGRVVAGVDLRIVDEAGHEQPWDGKNVGEIQARGPWIASAYYNNPLAPRVAKWWLPDEVTFIDAVPETSVGKLDKKVLRERFKAWKPKA